MKTITFKIFIILLLSITVCFCSKEELILEPIDPEKMPEVEKVPPLKAMITEIEEENGEQKFLYFKLGMDNEWYKKDLIGIIYNDVAMKEEIGKFKVVDIYEKFSKGEILLQSYPIDPKGVVLIEVDPRFLTKE